MSEEKNKPVKEFKAGLVKASIWSNKAKNQQGEEIEFKTVSFSRSYTDKEGEWHETQSMNRDDLPKLQLVLSKAYEFLALKKEEEKKEEKKE